MQRLIFGLAALLIVNAPPAEAGHVFSEGGSSSPQLAAGQGVEITIDSAAGHVDTGQFDVNLQFGFGTGETFNSGDVLRFTMNGESLLFDFDNPLLGSSQADFFLTVPITSGDPGFTEYDDQIVAGNIFTLELLSGDGLLFDGFTLSDGISAIFASAGAAGSTPGAVFNVPEPATALFLTLGLTALALRRRRSR